MGAPSGAPAPSGGLPALMPWDEPSLPLRCHLHHVREHTPVAIDTWVPLEGAARRGTRGELVVAGWSSLVADARAGDGVLCLDATLTRGPGFGVMVRGAIDGDVVPIQTHDPRPVSAGWAVQVDPGYGRGALLVRRWRDGWESHPVAVTAVAREDLYGGHRLRIAFGPGHLHATWGTATVDVDLPEAAGRLGRAWAAVDGDLLLLRTWGEAEVHVWGAELA